jgi:16S rRNA (guanine966-N2)-methyltransferase
MRIIAGEFRGRKLLSPETDTTRPITDRVKQSLFDILSPQIEGANVFDCFAGTGSMGLECLSRGSSNVTFFEIDRSALTRLRQNIATLKLEPKSRIVTTDIFKYQATDKTDLIFLDPPYRFLRDRPTDLQQLAARLSQSLNPDGTLVFRHDAADQLTLPLTPYDTRTYGNMTLEFLRS